jgi:hypothetical protein
VKPGSTNLITSPPSATTPTKIQRSIGPLKIQPTKLRSGIRAAKPKKSFDLLQVGQAVSPAIF